MFVRTVQFGKNTINFSFIVQHQCKISNLGLLFREILEAEVRVRNLDPLDPFILGMSLTRFAADTN